MLSSPIITDSLISEVEIAKIFIFSSDKALNILKVTPGVETIPAPTIEESDDFKMLVSNVDWSDYVGRIAVGKILSGSTKIGDTIWRLRKDHSPERSKVSKIFEYSALATNDASEGVAGNIIGLSGFEEIDIGETLAGNQDVELLPFVEPPISPSPRLPLLASTPPRWHSESTREVSAAQACSVLVRPTVGRCRLRNPITKPQRPPAS